MSFPSGPAVKQTDKKENYKTTCNAEDAGDAGLIPGLGRSPGGGNDDHSSILARRSHGQRNLQGYSP